MEGTDLGWVSRWLLAAEGDTAAFDASGASLRPALRVTPSAPRMPRMAVANSPLALPMGVAGDERRDEARSMEDGTLMARRSARREL